MKVKVGGLAYELRIETYIAMSKAPSSCSCCVTNFHDRKRKEDGVPRRGKIAIGARQTEWSESR